MVKLGRIGLNGVVQLLACDKCIILYNISGMFLIPQFQAVRCVCISDSKLCHNIMIIEIDGLHLAIFVSGLHYGKKKMFTKVCEYLV